jgi:hypothetical protein
VVGAGLKGLSFRKGKQVEVHREIQQEEEEEEEEEERPRKKRRVVEDDEGESEVEEVEEEVEEVRKKRRCLRNRNEGGEREGGVRKKARLSEWLDESEVEDVVLEPWLMNLWPSEGKRRARKERKLRRRW